MICPHCKLQVDFPAYREVGIPIYESQEAVEKHEWRSIMYSFEPHCPICREPLYDSEPCIEPKEEKGS